MRSDAGKHLIDSYHCSRYNTQTRRLTAGDVQEGCGAGVRAGRALSMNAVSIQRNSPRRCRRRPGVYRMYQRGTRAPLRRQGEESERSGRAPTSPPATSIPKIQALVQQIARHRGHGHRLRDRSAAARIQPDQGAQAALQRRPARRQELSLHPSVRSITSFRGWRSIAARAARRAVISGRFPNAGAVRDTLNQLQKLFRIRNCRRQLFRESQPAVPAAPDRALLGALRRSHLRAKPTRRTSRRR